jgi:hypothetical protein
LLKRLIALAGISNISGGQLMDVSNLPFVLGNIEQLDERFKRWRRGRPRGTKIPEDLWAAAVALAQEQGVNRTARRLRLDYYDLKKRVLPARMLDVIG